MSKTRNLARRIVRSVDAERPEFNSAKKNLRRTASLIIVAVLVVVVSMLVTELYRQEAEVLIQPIAVPKWMESKGLNSVGVARRLLDSLIAVQNCGPIEESPPTYLVSTSDELPDIQVRLGAFSFHGLVPFISRVTGLGPDFITGEIVGDPDNLTLSLRLGRRPRRDFDGEWKKLDMLVTHAAEHILLQAQPITLAHYLFYQGRRDKAQAAVKRGLRRRDSDSAVVAASLLAGTLAGQSGDHRLALNHFDRALAKSSQNARWEFLSLTNLGASLRNIGKNEAAIEKYRRAQLIGQTALGDSIRESDFSSLLINWGAALASSGKADLAIEKYREALRFKANDPVLYNNWGTALFAKGDLAKAESMFKKAIEIKSKYPEAINNLGIVFLKQKNYSAAFKKAQLALSLDQDYSKAYSLMGDVSKARGAVKDAINYYKQAISLDRNNISAYGSLAEMLRRLGQRDEEQKVLEEAMAVAPENADFVVLLANVILDEGELERAIKFYNKALELNPRHYEALVNLGYQLHNSGQYEKSEEMCEKARNIEPQRSDAYYCLGLSLVQRSREKEAAYQFKKAYELDPTDAQAYSNWRALERGLQND